MALIFNLYCKCNENINTNQILYTYLRLGNHIVLVMIAIGEGTFYQENKCTDIQSDGNDNL